MCRWQGCFYVYLNKMRITKSLLKDRIEIEHMANELRNTDQDNIENGTNDYYKILPLSAAVLAIILAAVLGWIFIQRRKSK